jgi:hypothetical protein
VAARLLASAFIDNQWRPHVVDAAPAAWIAAPTSYVGVNDPSGFSQEHQTTINAA